MKWNQWEMHFINGEVFVEDVINNKLQSKSFSFRKMILKVIWILSNYSYGKYNALVLS